MNENWVKGVRCTRLSGGSRECGSVSYGLRNQGACFAYWFFPSRWIICWYSWRSRPRHPAKIYCHLVNQTHRSVTIARVISTCSLHYFSPSSDRFVISTVNAEWIGKWMIYSLALHLSRLRKNKCYHRVGVLAKCRSEKIASENSKKVSRCRGKKINWQTSSPRRCRRCCNILEVRNFHSQLLTVNHCPRQTQRFIMSCSSKSETMLFCN